MMVIYISGRFEQKWGSAAVFVGALLGVIYLASLFGVSMVYLIGLALLVTLALCYVLKFEYALGAILALLHDVIVTVGLFALLDKEITLSFVAAILTIVGYSINDTIIIYDRIREQMQKSKKGDYAATINRGINETLSRTILTSGTTLMVIASLYFLGGPGNRDFALALLIGISIGTFSSIAVSAPALLLWTKKAAPTAG
jgi:preprotein translocase subunit SecF